VRHRLRYASAEIAANNAVSFEPKRLREAKHVLSMPVRRTGAYRCRHTRADPGRSTRNGQPSILPDVIGAFRDACPDVELVLDEMLASEIAEALRQRRIDVGFARPPLSQEEAFAQYLLLEEPYVAALPERHALAGRVEVALAELADEPFVAYPANPGPSVTDLVISACKAAGFVPRIVQEVLHLQTAVSLVAAGVGVTLVPLAAAQGQSRRGVTYITLSPPAPMAPLAVVWRDGDASPSLRRFLGILEIERARSA
jgi:LysR family transcriptional regulator, benzoate and cis,cis-muconate-responsive activator of ben and cat genes